MANSAKRCGTCFSSLIVLDIFILLIHRLTSSKVLNALLFLTICVDAFSFIAPQKYYHNIMQHSQKYENFVFFIFFLFPWKLKCILIRKMHFHIFMHDDEREVHKNFHSCFFSFIIYVRNEPKQIQQKN